MRLTLNQLLFRTSQAKDEVLLPVLTELGLGRGQPRILTYLYENGESSQNDIASYFSIDPASVSRMTENLQSNGFLTRREDSECRRTNRLSLTEKGRYAAEKWKKESEKVNSIMLSGFSEEEKKTFISYLERIIENYKRWENE